MGKWTQKKETLRRVMWFLVKFNLLLIPFYVVLYFDIDFFFLQELFASFIGSIVRVWGYFVEVNGIFIYVKNLAIDISRDCLGWKSTYSLVALVFASSGGLKEKLKFLLIWVPGLLVFNVFRVLLVILVGLKFGVRWFEIFHTYVWQQIMIFAIIGVWYLWLRKVNKINRSKQ